VARPSSLSAPRTRTRRSHRTRIDCALYLRRTRGGCPPAWRLAYAVRTYGVRARTGHSSPAAPPAAIDPLWAVVPAPIGKKVWQRRKRAAWGRRRRGCWCWWRPTPRPRQLPARAGRRALSVHTPYAAPPPLSMRAGRGRGARLVRPGSRRPITDPPGNTTRPPPAPMPTLGAAPLLAAAADRDVVACPSPTFYSFFYVFIIAALYVVATGSPFLQNRDPGSTYTRRRRCGFLTPNKPDRDGRRACGAVRCRAASSRSTAAWPAGTCRQLTHAGGGLYRLTRPAAADRAAAWDARIVMRAPVLLRAHRRCP
jgi:hypothetical protein